MTEEERERLDAHRARYVALPDGQAVKRQPACDDPECPLCEQSQAAKTVRSFLRLQNALYPGFFGRTGGRDAPA